MFFSVPTKYSHYMIALFSAIIYIFIPCKAGATDTLSSTTSRTLAYLNSIGKLPQSRYWPNIQSDDLLTNLKTFTNKPFAFYEGKSTNFCAYSALTYIPLTNDPLGFSKFMIELYTRGQAKMGKALIKPGKKIRQEAGLLRYKGALDINPAGQMWFLALADEFKGYLNLLNWNFDKGDENTFWASTNFAKFNKMLRRLFPGKVKAVGSDLFHPTVPLFNYMQTQMQKGLVFIYLNNKLLYKKTHTRHFVKTPTHYVMLTNISRAANGKIELIYWDYGRRSLQQLSPAFLQKIVYGITTYYPASKIEKNKKYI